MLNFNINLKIKQKQKKEQILKSALTPLKYNI